MRKYATAETFPVRVPHGAGPSLLNPHYVRASASERPGSETLLPPAAQLAWLLVQPAWALDETETAMVTRVEQDGTARAVTGLARRFTALVRATGRSATAAGDQDQDAAAEIDA